MSLTTVKEQAQKALAVVNKILEFGPRVPEFTGHIQAGVNEFVLAGAMIGLAAEGGGCSIAEAFESCPELKGKVEAMVAHEGVSANNGPFLDFLNQLLSNPALMQIVLMLLKLKLPV
jgi:hypothetical protein